MRDVIRDLRTIDAFARLTEEDFSELIAICKYTIFPAQSLLTQEGREAESLFALIIGTVSVWVDYGKAESDLLAIRKAPCLVGEMGVADELPRSATLVADTDIIAYTIDAKKFRLLIERRGHIALFLMTSISRLLRTTNDSFVNELRERNAELLKANKELRLAQNRFLRQERLSNLGKFSSMIIHDLRNPLSVIKGYADLLEFKLSKAKIPLHRYASQIRREVSRLSGITSELLDYSRGEIRLSYAPIRINVLFQQLKENVDTRLAAKNLDVTWDIAFGSSVLVDAERLLRVLINLTDNAQKACRRGGSIILRTAKSGNLLIITVQDNGVGMDEIALTHIFDPFFSTSERGGTGLGMHIVQTVVEAHNGNISIESTPEVGTTVILTLPLRI